MENANASLSFPLLWLSCGLAGYAPRSVVGYLRGVQRRVSRGRLLFSVEGTMYRIWYWAMIDRESDGRVVASVPDLDDVAVSASTEKDALAHLTVLAAERVRAAVEGGQRVPGRRHFTELPSRFRTKELGRAIIPVEVERTAAWPAPPFAMSP